MVQAEGLVAVFDCLYPNTSKYAWEINGIFRQPADFPPGIVPVSPLLESQVASLTIPAISEYNNTVVQCEVVVGEGEGHRFKKSNRAMLTVLCKSMITVRCIIINCISERKSISICTRVSLADIFLIKLGKFW